MVVGGFTDGPNAYHALTEKYDGTSWTETGDLSTTRQDPPTVGTTSAALAIGGSDDGDDGIVDVEEFNGTSWSEATGNINASRIKAAASGITTAALLFAGYNGAATATLASTETYDGTSWTEVADLATGRNYILAGQASPNTASIAFGGQIPSSSSLSTGTEEWDVSAAVETVAFD